MLNFFDQETYITSPPKPAAIMKAEKEKNDPELRPNTHMHAYDEGSRA